MTAAVAATTAYPSILGFIACKTQPKFMVEPLNEQSQEANKKSEIGSIRKQWLGLQHNKAAAAAAAAAAAVRKFIF